jgi:hypothetical protein
MRTPLAMALLAALAACGPKPTDTGTKSPEPGADEGTHTPPPSDSTPAETETAERDLPPAPAGLAAGIISDFESGELGSEFGSGWQLATDAMTGGASTVELEVENGALKMVGTIDAAAGADAWAGAMFFPGDQAMRPANLDSKPTLAFQARGDGPLVVMVFAEHLGTKPAVTRVELGHEWGKHEVDMRTLAGEVHDITAIVFSGPSRPGKFETHVDDIRLK